MMGHSVCLRFVDWLHGFIDHSSKLGMKQLSKLHVHAKAGTDMRLGRISVVNDGLREGQINNAAPMSALNEQCGDYGRNAIIFDDPVYIAHAKRLAAPNHNFISHQKSPIGIVLDLSIVNAKAVGVES